MQIQNAALTAKRNHIDAKMYPIDTLKKVYRVLLFIMRKIIGAVRYDKEISYKNEQGQLKSNPYVQMVSDKAITYTGGFKRLFIAEHEKGKSSRAIFEESGLDVELIGLDRVKFAGNRWRRSYRTNGTDGSKDTRKGNSGRPLGRELSAEEKLSRLEAQNRLLQAENELLKKLELFEKQAILTAEQKFQLIHQTIEKYQLKRMVSYLCAMVDVSRSGYYNYFNEPSIQRRTARDLADKEVKEITLKAYRFRRRKKVHVKK